MSASTELRKYHRLHGLQYVCEEGIHSLKSEKALIDFDSERDAKMVLAVINEVLDTGDATARVYKWSKSIGEEMPMNRDAQDRDVENILAITVETLALPFIAVELRRALYCQIAARIRDYQTLPDGPTQRALGQCVGALTKVTKIHSPGLVWGLALSHTPENGSWAEDCRLWAKRIAAKEAA